VKALAAALLALAACSPQPALNYKHCLRLRVGMSRADMLTTMGPPAETFPYVEGKSLPYLKGRTAYEWPNPATMPGVDHVSVDDATGKVESIRCSNAEITASVFVEPPAPSTAAAAARPAANAPAPTVSSAPSAGFSEALAAYRRKDFVAAFKDAGPSAQDGNSDAQMLVAMIFLNGAAPGREKDGQNAAQMWLYKAARQKNAEAQAVYAALLMGGGAPAQTVVDEIKAAADMSAPAGKLLLADVYLKGLYPDIVPQDDKEGEKWLLLSAQGGDPAAQLELGRLLADRKNAVTAYRWTLAASRHEIVDKFADPMHSLSTGWSDGQSADARKFLAELKAKMTASQVRTAETAAASAP
jgi:TPR repeat protein